MHTTHRRAAAVSLAALTLLVPATVATAADPVNETFVATGAEQQFVVPATVTSVHVELVGAHGGPNSTDSASGGFGARVEGDLAVTPGQTLYIYVGTNGGVGSVGGFNGGRGAGSPTGGRGGGASDIRSVGGVVNTVDEYFARVLVVAGGGGGAGGGTGSGGCIPGVGGAAGLPGTTACGGGGHGGGAGTSASGGAGGLSDFPGQAGIVGAGGVGGLGGAAGTGGNGGGGGGGGYFGGGGGGGGATPSPNGGGGGGGSSFTGAATNATVAADSSGVPAVTISYEPMTDRGAVGADVTVLTSAACLELSTTHISFGTLALGDENVPAAPSVTITNCSGSAAQLLASGTDATGTGAQWALVSGIETCADTLGLDRFRLNLAAAEWQGDSSLGTDPAYFTSLASGQSSEQTAKIWLACPGSTGAGQTMNMSINYLAVEE